MKVGTTTYKINVKISWWSIFKLKVLGIRFGTPKVITKTVGECSETVIEMEE